VLADLIAYGLLAFGLVLGLAWIVAIVDAARYPGAAFRGAGHRKGVALFTIAITGGIGALVWLLHVRRLVRAAAGAMPGRPRPDPWADDATW
jgi:hypothetical protein